MCSYTPLLLSQDSAHIRGEFGKEVHSETDKEPIESHFLQPGERTLTLKCRYLFKREGRELRCILIRHGLNDLWVLVKWKKSA